MGGSTRSPSWVPLYPFLGEGSPKIDYRKKGTLILTSLLEDPGLLWIRGVVDQGAQMSFLVVLVQE